MIPLFPFLEKGHNIKTVTQTGQKSLDKSVTDKSGIADILQNFSTSASMHGLGKITQVRYTPLRVIWILATLTCSGLLIAQIYQQVHLYNEYNKKTVLTVNYDPITFPDVTICNHRHIDVDILYSLFSQSHLNHSDLAPIEEIVSRARPELETKFTMRVKGYRKTWEYYSKLHANYTRLEKRLYQEQQFGRL